LFKWLLFIYKNVEIFNVKLTRLEPTKIGLDYTKNRALNEIRLSWLGVADDVRTSVANISKKLKL